jgi:hypothetical protein
MNPHPLYQELVNLALFFKCLIEVALVTGFILVPIVVLGYELGKRRAL